ncbi:MAG TPA: cation:proton antiporter [Spirochaetia bacterium]|nr:cation:proton antiporter [Spirochaetia bacterium]
MEMFIVELVAVFVIAVLVGIVFRYFGLPSIIGHVLSGFILGLSGLIGSPSVLVLESLGVLGVTLLLFLVGLEMNWNEIRKVGKEAVFLFLGQTLLLIAIYVVFGLFAIGFAPLTAILFAVAMTFSSTIVVVKVLSEKKELNSYSGRLTLGVLLLQDVLAIGMLVFLPSVGKSVDVMSLVTLLGKMVMLVLAVNVVGHFIISQLMKHVIKTAEDLVLFSLAWFALVIYGSVKLFGLSPEVGGLLAGLSLSTSWGHFQIVSKIRVLRDVFLTLFFVLLGFQVGLGGVNWILFLVLIPMIVVVKFLVSHLVSRVVGLSGRNAIMMGINMTQMSEFSLVVLSVGLTNGLWQEPLVKAVTMAGLFSMALSTMFISKSEKLSIGISKLSKILFKFRGKNHQTKVEHKNHIVLFGGDRTGKSILSFLKKIDENIVVVDFNPQVVKELKRKGDTIIFADATDPDVLELTNIAEAKLVISTIKNVNDSLSLITELKNKKIDVPIIADAESFVQAKELYEAGVSYVIFPHFVSGWHMSQVVKKYGKDKDTLVCYKKRQDIILKSIYEGQN